MRTFIVMMVLLIAESAMAVQMKFEEKVRSVTEKGDKYEVTFKKMAAFYHVTKGSPQEKSVLPVLQEKLKSQEPVKFAVDSDTHEVLSVEK